MLNDEPIRVTLFVVAVLERRAFYNLSDEPGQSAYVASAEDTILAKLE